MNSVSAVHIENVSVQDVWARLKSDPQSVMIDCRTRAEWAYVGLPDLSGIGKQLLTVEWQTFPDNRINPQFVVELASQLDAAGVKKDAEIFFICRSGGRSRMAAQVMTEAGYERCRNVTEGFEGPLDPLRHRGRASGWKVAGLPWVQG
ncbi:MAG TPA: rhodanese-like domain-containing protein [Hyphomicrobiaceae bacterium]|nr:rhodanese-like domain-containing protein [Hyphomicrobiaceae bacterium]